MHPFTVLLSHLYYILHNFTTWVINTATQKTIRYHIRYFNSHNKDCNKHQTVYNNINDIIIMLIHSFYTIEMAYIMLYWI